MRIDQDHVHTTKEKVSARKISGFRTCVKTVQGHAEFVLQVSRYFPLLLQYDGTIYDTTIVARQVVGHMDKIDFCQDKQEDKLIVHNIDCICFSFYFRYT